MAASFRAKVWGTSTEFCFHFFLFPHQKGTSIKVVQSFQICYSPPQIFLHSLYFLRGFSVLLRPCAL